MWIGIPFIEFLKKIDDTKKSWYFEYQFTRMSSILYFFKLPTTQLAQVTPLVAKASGVSKLEPVGPKL